MTTFFSGIVFVSIFKIIFKKNISILFQCPITLWSCSRVLHTIQPSLGDLRNTSHQYFSLSATMSTTFSATLYTSMSATMSNSMSAIFFVGCHVGHHVGHLVHLHVGHHVHLHISHHVGHHVDQHNVVSMLSKVSETLIEWKSESVMNLLTDWPGYVLEVLAHLKTPPIWYKHIFYYTQSFHDNLIYNTFSFSEVCLRPNTFSCFCFRLLSLFFFVPQKSHRQADLAKNLDSKDLAVKCLKTTHYPSQGLENRKATSILSTFFSIRFYISIIFCFYISIIFCFYIFFNMKLLRFGLFGGAAVVRYVQVYIKGYKTELNVNIQRKANYETTHYAKVLFSVFWLQCLTAWSGEGWRGFRFIEKYLNGEKNCLMHGQFQLQHKWSCHLL